MKKESFTEILSLTISLLEVQNKPKILFILLILVWQNAIEPQMESIFLSEMVKI
jgi:hypothetical protein